MCVSTSVCMFPNSHWWTTADCETPSGRAILYDLWYGAHCYCVLKIQDLIGWCVSLLSVVSLTVVDWTLLQSVLLSKYPWIRGDKSRVVPPPSPNILAGNFHTPNTGCIMWYRSKLYVDVNACVCGCAFFSMCVWLGLSLLHTVCG
jgi:hypothetical protein